MALKKIMLNLDESLLADIEEYAAKMHLNRTAAITVLCTTTLQAQKAVGTMEQMLAVYNSQRGLSPKKSGVSITP